ncbi:MAG: outer membrane beta-barrel protein [Ignavibacteriae bacterium]|nr:outer membrane beta-barrel protein [Ignavibacteriota bacterium]
MKTLQLIIASSIILFLSIHSGLQAQTSIGFYTGLSTPSEQINNVYNTDSLMADNFIGRMKRNAVNLGYHVGVRLRFALGDDLVFMGGLSLTRFPQSKIYVSVPNGTQGDSIRATLTTTQNVIPIGVGLNYYLTRKVLGIYGIGELTYNYLTNSIDAEYNGAPIPLDNSPTYNRVGFGLGAGMDIDLKLLTLNLEGKYNLVNFIGSEDGEKSKSFVTLSIGVYFGSTSTAK